MDACCLQSPLPQQGPLFSRMKHHRHPIPPPAFFRQGGRERGMSSQLTCQPLSIQRSQQLEAREGMGGCREEMEGEHSMLL
jgi:hypothetical protein